MEQASVLETLQKVLQYHFREPLLLQQALLHRSFVYENPQNGQGDNETFEFLGDAVLNLAISHLLLEKFPNYKEGDLSRMRSSIVNERELARLALKLNLGKYLFLGKGEELTGGRYKPSLLANSLEALLAAVYLDSDLATVIGLVKRIFQDYLEVQDYEHPLKSLDKDYKTQLQEYTQAHFKETPSYFLEAEEGPDHDKMFFVGVFLEERLLARGSGKSKKEAQQLAAQKALDKLRAEEQDAF
jgi:ribonuclease III